MPADLNLTPDLRTREGREAEVLDQVRRHRGFSVFWATEFATRAHAIERLIERGTIARGPERQFPWCAYHMAFMEAHRD